MNPRTLILPLALLSTLHLGGCATAAKPQMMVAEQNVGTPANPKLVGAIAVSSVAGGKSTNPLWSSQVDSSGFKQALGKSLRIAGYLASSGNSSYQLSAHLAKLKQPWIGASMSVTSTVNYKLTGPEGTTEIPVTATGVAGAFEKFYGVARLQMANERSISENIKELLARLTNY